MRRLSLKKETVVELTTGELGDVQGGASGPTCIVCVSQEVCVSGIVTCATDRCPTRDACFTTDGCG